MPRTPPTVPLPTLASPKLEPWTIQLQTITPMFGGSAETRQVDPEHPIRAASVRGHLRFWWRATAGASCKNAGDLYKKESKIWGNTKQHGKVRLEVTNQQATPKKLLGDIRLPRATAYATFPFRRQQNGTLEAPLLEKVTFDLTLFCPSDLRLQVETALHTWVMFGGIGARTRRGCGSLTFADSPFSKLQAPTESPTLLTTLSARFFVGKKQNDALNAWADAVKVYQDFRQGDGIARTSSQGRPPVNGKKAPPGRSFWPEPDTLRRLLGHAYKHPPRFPENDGFPRADLGLPIIFHFKDEKAGDPRDHTLQGSENGKERFASPVITKAAVLDGQIVPLIMMLDSPHVWEGAGVSLVNTKSEAVVVKSIANEKLKRIQKQEPQNGLPIREAFKKFVRENGFQEVPL